MNLFNKSGTIRKRRVEKNQTIEELAWGICDETTLGRYERGKVDPSVEKLSLILEKLDIKNQGMVVSHEISLFSDNDCYEEFEKLLHDKKLEEINIRLEKYESGMEINNTIEKKQFLERIKLFMSMDRGELYIHELEDLLMESIGDYSSGKISLTNIYNETELYILNDIAIGYWDLGRRDLALNIYKDLIEYFKNFIYNQDSVICNKICLNYSNYLGLSGNYQDSIKTCLDTIRWMQNNTTQDLMYVFIFNIGWNYYYLWKRTGDFKLKEKAEAYIEKALALGNYYHENEDTINIMRQFYQNEITSTPSSSSNDTGR